MYRILNVIQWIIFTQILQVHYIKQEFPGRKFHPTASELSERDASFRNYSHSLEETVDNYNWLKTNTREEEFNLILEEIQDIDQQLEKAEHILNWNSDGTFPWIFLLLVLIKNNQILEGIIKLC